MTETRKRVSAVLLAALTIGSVFAGSVFAAGVAASGTDAQNNSLTQLQEGAVQEGSLKPMTLSWFRDDGDANGPYPVPPNEYGGNQSPAIQMFFNAKADGHIRTDDSTAKNPNGKWDMLVFNIEVSEETLNELNPPTWEDTQTTGLVTQNFLEGDNWDFTLSQVNGEKTLDIAANQENFESPQLAAGTEQEIPPVMVFAATSDTVGGEYRSEIMTDYMADGEPDTSLYVWIDPNRAKLTDGNGDTSSFETGESYNGTFEIHGHTESVTVDMVEGDTTFDGDYATAPNSGTAQLGGGAALAAGTDVEIVVDPGEGENMTVETEVSGNELWADYSSNPGTIPRGPAVSEFDLSGLAGQTIDVYVYAESGRGTGDFVNLSGHGEVEVEQSIVQDYTIESTTLHDGKVLTIPYTNPQYQTPSGIGVQVGDGHLTGDTSIAYNTEVENPYFDEMFLHYETGTQIFDAVRLSPGGSRVEKLLNSPLSLEVTQTNGDKHLDLAENASGVTVVLDNGSSDARLYNGSQETGIFFSFKLNDMVFFNGDGEKVQPEIGDQFEATLSIETEESGTLTETVSFHIVEGETVIINQPGQLELPSSENTQIVVNSTQATSTAMGITLYTPNGEYEQSSGEITIRGMGPVIAGGGPATLPWGQTTSTFDTSGLEPGTEVVAEVRIIADLPGEYGNPMVARMTGQIVAPPTATVSIADQSGGGSAVTVESVNLSDGGFVAIRRGSPTGTTLGTTGYLEPGVHDDLEVSLDSSLSEDQTVYAVVHLDTNNNQEYNFPVADDTYSGEGGEVVAGSASYTVEAQATATATSTPTATATPTEGSENGADTATPTPTTSDGQPGFTFAAIFIALIAVVLLARRRD